MAIIIGGILAVLVTIYTWQAAIREPIIRWSLLALLMYTASLGIYHDESGIPAPPLIPPFQLLRAYGRPISGLLLAFLLTIIIAIAKQPRKWFPPELNFLLFIQFLAFFKTSTQGDPIIGLSTFAVFIAVLYSFTYGISNWLEKTEDVNWIFYTIGGAVGIFILVCSIQSFFNFYPLFFKRFLGTTGNPQHAAVLLASGLPVIYLFYNLIPQKLKFPFWILLALALYFLFSTRSRTGFLIAIIGLLFMYKNEIFERLIPLSIAGIFVMIVYISGLIYVGGSVENFFSEDTNTYINQQSARGNTREKVWNAQIKSFTHYPIFGKPLRGRKVGYGENSWLAVGAAFGIIGVIPMLFFGLLVIRKIIILDRIRNFHPKLKRHCSAVAGGLSGLLIGAIGEAYLLGTLTFPLMCLILYLVAGEILLFQIKSYINQPKYELTN